MASEDTKIGKANRLPRDSSNLVYAIQAEKREGNAQGAVSLAVSGVFLARIDTRGIRAIRVLAYPSSGNVNIHCRQIHKGVYGTTTFNTTSAGGGNTLLIEYPAPFLEIVGERNGNDCTIFASWYLVPFDVVADP